MRKRLVLMGLILCAVAANAQWRVGLNAGWARNTYTTSSGYQYDWKYGIHHGFTVGLTAQYDVKDWFGVRVDYNVTQKGYSQTRALMPEMNYTYDHYYMQLPVMANFSFGGKKLRGYTNVGVYAGLWAGGNYHGTVPALTIGSLETSTVPVAGKYEFMKARDQRADFGFVAAWGLEYFVKKSWVVFMETSIYYSVLSTAKSVLAANNPHYNTTLTTQVGAAYRFPMAKKKGLIHNNNKQRLAR